MGHTNSMDLELDRMEQLYSIDTSRMVVLESARHRSTTRRTLSRCNPQSLPHFVNNGCTVADRSRHEGRCHLLRRPVGCQTYVQQAASSSPSRCRRDHARHADARPGRHRCTNPRWRSRTSRSGQRGCFRHREEMQHRFGHCVYDHRVHDSAHHDRAVVHHYLEAHARLHLRRWVDGRDWNKHRNRWNGYCHRERNRLLSSAQAIFTNVIYSANLETM